MANTYTQIHIQAVFAVQDRDSIIHKNWQDDLYKYITGIIQNHQHKLLAINGMSDHIHIQQEHHTRKTFHDEYMDLLKEFEIEYDARFVFKPVDINYIVPDGTSKTSK